MSSIFVIVQHRNSTAGHGDCSEVKALAMTGIYDTPPAHPAFTSAEKANSYIASLSCLERVFLKPFELHIKE